jgi:methylphosphotriester-DNA--protein-cysteine methyltransferase
MGGVASTKPTTLTTVERESIVVERRSSNVPFRVIAAELGLSVARVHGIFKEACDRIPAEAVHTVRVQSSDLYDRAVNDLLKIAENPQVSPRTRAEAWNAIRGWNESFRKLMGADAPQRREISVVSGETIDNAIMELTKEMAAMEAQAQAAGITVLA